MGFSRPGELTVCDIEHGPVEIVDFPVKNGGSFHGKMLVHQRVWDAMGDRFWWGVYFSLNIRGKGLPCNLNIGRFPDAFVSFVRFSFFISEFVHPKYATGATASLLNQGSHQVRKASSRVGTTRAAIRVGCLSEAGGEVRRLGGWFEATRCGNLATQQRDLTRKYRTRQQSSESYWLYKSDSPAQKWDDDPNWMVFL